MEYWELLFIFFFIAAVYSSVGFGGGSSYLAMLSLYSFSFYQIRSTALLCNIIVVAFGCYIFYRRGHISCKKILPLVIFSIPLAFLGGLLQLKPIVFFILLGSSLILTSVIMWFQPWEGKADSPPSEKYNNALLSSSLGSGVGFLSGMVGIGGGIFLAPILHLLRWDTPKRIAATASFFILVNSIAGLLGQMSNPQFNINWSLALALMAAVFIGGQVGSRFGSGPFSQSTVKRLTAIVIFAAGIRVLWKYIFLV